MEKLINFIILNNIDYEIKLEILNKEKNNIFFVLQIIFNLKDNYKLESEFIHLNVDENLILETNFIIDNNNFILNKIENEETLETYLICPYNKFNEYICNKLNEKINKFLKDYNAKLENSISEICS